MKFPVIFVAVLIAAVLVFGCTGFGKKVETNETQKNGTALKNETANKTTDHAKSNKTSTALPEINVNVPENSENIDVTDVDEPNLTYETDGTNFGDAI